jgi:hypothetical protein
MKESDKQKKRLSDCFLRRYFFKIILKNSLLVNINVSKLINNQRGKSMSKTFLIRDIPERDWKKFKRWTVVHDYDNLNHAITTLIKRAGNDELGKQADKEALEGT